MRLEILIRIVVYKKIIFVSSCLHASTRLEYGSGEKETQRAIELYKLIKKISFKFHFHHQFVFFFSFLFNKYLHNVHQIFVLFLIFFFTLNLFDFSISFLCLRLSFVSYFFSTLVRAHFSYKCFARTQNLFVSFYVFSLVTSHLFSSFHDFSVCFAGLLALAVSLNSFPKRSS